MKVNILMSTYNGERFLAEQIESIQKQTFTEWHLLIRDDGSSDKTLDIIKDYVAKDSRIRFINEENPENLGVIKSFYNLVKYEKADCYFFSDQDDVWLEDKLENQLAAFAKEDSTKPVMVYMDLKVVDANLNIINPSMIKSQSHHANTKLVQELTENTVTGGVSGINHALAEKWTTVDNVIMHDWYLALLATATGRLVFVDKAGELYRQHENNVLGARTLSKRVRKWMQPHLLFQKYWELIRASQLQAEMLLLSADLSSEDKEMVEAFVSLLDKSFIERLKILKKYGLRKNKGFHTVIFSFLIATKFLYKE